MSSFRSEVLSATRDSVVLRFETRVTPAEFFREKLSAIDQGPGYYVVQRADTEYSWEDLERRARDTPDNTERSMFGRMLQKARELCPAHRLLSRIVDTNSINRQVSLYHLTRPELGEAKQWEQICTVTVKVASDGTWCALLDVTGTTDMGVTHETPSAAGLAKHLSKAFAWAYEKKRGKAPKRRRAPRKKKLPAPGLRALPKPKP